MNSEQAAKLFALEEADRRYRKAEREAAPEPEPEHVPNRAERRRRAKVAGRAIPDSLDTRRPGWDRRLLDVIDKVYVNGVLIPECVAYNQRARWAKPKGSSEVYGEVVVTRKTTT